MKKLIIIALTGMVLSSGEAFCQSGKMTQLFDEPVMTDSLSTIFFPIRYEEGILTSNKIAFWGNYYANIIIYDFKADQYRKLFTSDTFIESFRYDTPYGYRTVPGQKVKNVTPKWVFLLVKTKDYNNNGKIDERDPSVLFVTTTKGENLKQLTGETEQVVSFDLFNDQGFGLIKIQRDADKDKSFKSEDRDYYYKKIDLNDLSLGRNIELR